MKTDNVIRVPCDIQKFFKLWLLFLQPFHNLTLRELEVASVFIRERYFLSKVIKDDDILDKVILGDDVKNKIKEEVKMTNTHFQVLLYKLKKANFFINGKVNKKFIPNLKEDATSFQLLFYFDFDEHEKVSL